MSTTTRSRPRGALLAAAAAAVLGLAAAPAGAGAQQPPASGAAAQPAPPPPVSVGDMAPDFSLPGATRFGLLRDPVKLSSFRGQSVVLAFFFKARTRG